MTKRARRHLTSGMNFRKQVAFLLMPIKTAILCIWELMCVRQEGKSQRENIILENGATLGEVLHGNAQTSKKPARAGQSQQNIKEDKEREECKEINLLLNLAQGQRYLLL